MPTDYARCAAEGCEAKYPAHKWGQIKDAAHWFHQKDGTSWCPDHIPEWVEQWRARRAAGLPPEPWRGGGRT